ncbi:MAG: hypothetical protein EOP35_02450 [Rubrivivax sp.]|nr:MAG: hypothetical protein EOP35_02450 [Rubrivivax sp.]
MSRAMLETSCPRCSGGFECGASSGPAGHCACFDIRLTDGLRAQLAERYPDRCLCLRCLRELMEADAPQPTMGSASASG